MESLHVTVTEGTATLQMDYGKANAINEIMVRELRQQVAALAGDTAVTGVILTGKGNFFSAGLNVVELYDYNEDRLMRFWHDFHRLTMALMEFPKPLVTAVNGHAPAGGCVLAMPGDYRIMAEGQCRIGLNEAAVGVVLPAPIADMMSFCVGESKAHDLILNASLLLPGEALAAGLVHEVCPPDDLMERAEARLARWRAMELTVWGKTKQNLRGGLIAKMDQGFEAGYNETLSHWWSDAGRAEVKKLVDQLMK